MILDPGQGALKRSYDDGEGAEYPFEEHARKRTQVASHESDSKSDSDFDEDDDGEYYSHFLRVRRYGRVRIQRFLVRVF